MNLKELLAGVACEVVQGRPDVEVKMIHFDSRKVGEGDLFIAQRGVNADGHEYITKAVAAGAVAVVCEEVPGELKEGVVYVKTGNSSEALGVMSSNFYGNPSRRMKVVGVTGTNGKTTTATLLYELCACWEGKRDFCQRCVIILVMRGFTLLTRHRTQWRLMS